MTVFDPRTTNVVAELDAAIEAHLGWTRRVLRCAVLGTSPGDDVLAADAHRRCRFGRWFTQYRETLAEVDAPAVTRSLAQHEQMHDAVRALCTDLMAQRRGQAADLERFEATQSALVAELAHLKTGLLARSARHDPLTGLPLRYGLEEECTRFQALTQRIGQAMVLVMVDVDHFKVVNDTHGHAVGDEALRHLAAILRAQARAEEPVFRFGGEEFLVVLHTADAAAAGVAADRLLQAVRERPLQASSGALLPLRVSAGLAIVGADEPLARALARADTGLYAAKRGGRDRWCWGEG